MRAGASGLYSTSSTELVEAFSAAETQMRPVYSHMLNLLAEIDSRGVATGLGYSNTPALLMHTVRISRAEARHRLAQAEVLNQTITPTGSVIEPVLPQTAAALAEGTIDPDHVDVTRATLKDLPHFDPEQRAVAEKVMLERAAEDDPRALARFGWRVRDMVDPDGPPPVDTEPQRPERELHRHIRRDGSMDFKGRLDPENAALFEALLKPFDKRHNETLEGPDTRGYAERGGDAFADVLRMAANCPDLPTQNGLKTEVAFTISFEALKDALDDTVLPGSDLTAREARRLACDAQCAMRRSVVYPTQLGGIWRIILGSDGLPGTERRRGQQHASEAAVRSRRQG